MHLRNWQKKIIDNFPSIINEHRRFILKAPTGAGKTVLASEIVERFYKGKKILVLCHRLVLLEQLEMALGEKHTVRKLAVPSSADPVAAGGRLCQPLMRWAPGDHRAWVGKNLGRCTFVQIGGD